MNSKKEIFLRFAEESDCSDLYRWRNDPTTVKFSPSSQVEYSSHRRWFAKKIKDSQTHLFIITDPHNKIGMVRFDQKESQAEISINLNPQYRGQGYGKASIKKALETYFNNFPLENITARIDPQNTISQKLFQKMGFKQSGQQDENNQILFNLSQKDFLNNQIQIGLKFWSNDTHLFPEAVKQYKKKRFDFIELYVLPGSFEEKKFQILTDANIPVNIHCPHAEHNFNLMLNDEKSIAFFEEAKRAADFFHSQYIIVHPGIGTDKETLFHNLTKINDSRIAIENLPYLPVFGEEKLYGYTFEMIKEILQFSRKGFCLDFGHAIKAAKTLDFDPQEFITQLLTLQPQVFHIGDGFCENEKDEHLNLGEGNFNLNFLKQCVRENPSKMVVFETPRGKNLAQDIKNIEYFKNL